MKCVKCNNELIKYANGENIEYICPVCDEIPTTQSDNLIEFDPNQYIVKILRVENYEKNMLKAVSRICCCNVLEAKRILEVTGKTFKAMDAIETRALKNLLEKNNIAYSILPEFNW